MNCPQCNSALKHETIKGVDIERCAQCTGIWLTAPDLENLQDRDFETNELENASILEAKESDLSCPFCQDKMQRVNYDRYDMRLDFCPRHGYWISKEQQEKVLRFLQNEPKQVTN